MTDAAFSSEYTAGFPRMVMYARRHGVPDPENLAQQAWADAWEHLEQYEGREGASFQTWLHAILLNEIRGYWRRPVNRFIEYVAELPVMVLPQPKECDEVGQILSRIPMGQRAVLIAHYLRGQTYEQIAAETGVSFAALKSRAHRSVLAARRPVRQYSAVVAKGRFPAYAESAA
jgi:RNA polymerase sigma factor (sigma-70 family)